MKIRIPFTDLSLELSHIFVGFLAIINFPLTRATSVKGDCYEPIGDYLQTCKDIAIEPYVSTDPRVPVGCVLTADCPTMFSGLPPMRNEIYIPTHILLDEMSNDNGTLTYSERPLAADNEDASADCVEPSGSYAKTCKVLTKHYVSTDPKLQKTEFCEAELTCKTLSQSRQSNVVYHNLKSHHFAQQSAQKIENCDGNLVVGENDQQCDSSTAENIKKIAAREGRSELTYSP